MSKKSGLEIADDVHSRQLLHVLNIYQKLHGLDKEGRDEKLLDELKEAWSKGIKNVTVQKEYIITDLLQQLDCQTDFKKQNLGVV